MKDYTKGGTGVHLISAYNQGIVLAKVNYEYMEKGERIQLLYIPEYYVLYDRKGSVYKIDSIHIMNTKISVASNENTYRTSSILPITCGKYGYMLVEHDVLESHDPNNDNPIIIIGTLK